MNYILKHRRYGTYLYAVGGKEDAAWTSGINVKRMKLSVYLINSALAACAGFIYAARLSAANPSQGNGLELNGICAAVLGGIVLGGAQRKCLRSPFRSHCYQYFKKRNEYAWLEDPYTDDGDRLYPHCDPGIRCCKEGGKIMKPKEFMMKYSRILILVLIMVFVSAASLDFLKPSNLLNVARQSSMLLIMSLGMTCAMLLGQGVDMSIGATLSLTSCVAAGFLRSNASVGSVLFGIGIAILIGMFIGLINGALTAWLHLPAFLVTYGVRRDHPKRGIFLYGRQYYQWFSQICYVYGIRLYFWSDTYTDRDRSGFNNSYSLDVKAYPYGARTLHSRCQSKCSKIFRIKSRKICDLRLYAFRRTGCAGRYCIPGPPGSSRGRDWKSVPFSVCQCSSHWMAFPLPVEQEVHGEQ